MNILKPKQKLSGCIDYFRMTFKQHDIEFILNEVLRMREEYFFREKSGKYGYVELFQFDQIRVYLSAPLDKRGIMIELAGQGCRELEAILEAQKRTWFDFIETAMQAGGKITRLDIAVDDTKEYIHIPDCLTFTELRYAESRFNSFTFNGTGNINTGETEGVTIYFGSKKSNIYLTMYQKNYEQAKKQKVSVEEIGAWNRYELRFTDERAELALEELLKVRDCSIVGRGVLKEYLAFHYDESLDTGKLKLKKLVKGWDRLIRDIDAIPLKVAPKTNFYQRTENWLRSQAAASMRMVQIRDDMLETDSTIEDMITRAKLSDRQVHMLEVLVGNMQDFICE
ncbi:Replication initiation factor [Listeria grayi]|uniref:Replication initiation factor n=1 Tax=Listeria grayi FSL F6-1183 TaxID=1265827 RepID=A0A829R4K6_LISGR|nr:replication initiation factor domain-containing protein [Listeria grayi]EUJ26643.1 replication initiation factor [Listeria grayi FSL F6-1183]VEI35963.1 Replication initiation factor [Listeria grayi]